VKASFWQKILRFRVAVQFVLRHMKNRLDIVSRSEIVLPLSQRLVHLLLAKHVIYNVQEQVRIGCVGNQADAKVSPQRGADTELLR
jgi:hypothetical protein